MPAAAVIIPAVVAAAGTAATISAQNKQAAQQNAAIDAQISSNKNQEAIRQAANSYQMKIINQSNRLERIARTAEFKAKQQEANLQAQQAGYANASAKQAADTELAKGQTTAVQQGRALEQQQYGIDKQRIADTNTLREQDAQIEAGVTGVLGSTAASVAQSAQRAKEIGQNVDKINRDTTSLRAQMYAMGMGRGASADVLQAQKGTIDDALNQLQTTREVAANAEQQNQDANKAADLNRRVTALNYGLQERELSDATNLAAGQKSMLTKYQTYLQEQADSTKTGADIALSNVQRQVALTKKSNKLNNKIANNQARMDKTLTKAGMVTGYQLSAANAASQRAALASQKVSGPGGAEAFTGIAQSLTPLLRLYGGNSTSASVQPYQGYQTASYGTAQLPNLGGTISRYPSTITSYPPSTAAVKYTTNSSIKF